MRSRDVDGIPETETGRASEVVLDPQQRVEPALAAVLATVAAFLIDLRHEIADRRGKPREEPGAIVGIENAVPEAAGAEGFVRSVAEQPADVGTDVGEDARLRMEAEHHRRAGLEQMLEECLRLVGLSALGAFDPFAQRAMNDVRQPLEPTHQHTVGRACFQAIDNRGFVEIVGEADVGHVGTLLGRKAERFSGSEAGGGFIGEHQVERLPQRRLKLRPGRNLCPLAGKPCSSGHLMHSTGGAVVLEMEDADRIRHGGHHTRLDRCDCARSARLHSASPALNAHPVPSGAALRRRVFLCM